jgi:hypothetical protein
MDGTDKGGWILSIPMELAKHPFCKRTTGVDMQVPKKTKMRLHRDTMWTHFSIFPVPLDRFEHQICYTRKVFPYHTVDMLAEEMDQIQINEAETQY